MTSITEAVEGYTFLCRVLAVYDKADIQGSLFWRVYDGKPKLLATCNDTFWWATADCEEITPENVDVLEQALRDIESLDERSGAVIYMDELFVARVRKMRPQRPWYMGKSPAVAALFDACGPERDRADEG